MKKLIFLALLFLFYPKPVSAQTSSDWYMLGANPQRTSWVESTTENQTEIKGQLYPQWYKTIEPYIPGRVQIIVANDTLYISTARGLYAFDTNGNQKWVFPTEMPLGHSPTVVNGVVYVGGMDHKLYAVNAGTGEKIWEYEATQGFDTNPLVVGNNVYLGNRDGYLYAVGTDGNLRWKFKTDGPINFSAVYKNNTIYFASNDSYAYALNLDGTLKWKSAKLPGEGFHSYWPTIYTDNQTGKDYVIFGGSFRYRKGTTPRYGYDLVGLDKYDILSGLNQNDSNYEQYRGTLIFPKTADYWLDTSQSIKIGTVSSTPLTTYFQQKPWRRTYFVLDAVSGQEQNYAPILWFGSHSGNRYPAIVGSDNVLYQSNWYLFDRWIPAGQVSGWRFGTDFINYPSTNWNANDEPEAYSGGGNLIYWNRIGNRAAGAFDISKPNNRLFPQGADSAREWWYFNYFLDINLPNYTEMYVNWQSLSIPGSQQDSWSIYGTQNGVYGVHGDVSPPIPYKGKVYFLKFNSLMAFGPQNVTPQKLPTAIKPSSQTTQISLPTAEQLKIKLKDEIAKILATGHLRPGYTRIGNADYALSQTCGFHLQDLWHEPIDTLDTLIQALPYLPIDSTSPVSQDKVKTYIKNEFANYSPIRYTHIGWATGAPRDIFDLPPEDQAALSTFPAQVIPYSQFAGWKKFSPAIFYTLWKYAQIFGEAKSLFDQSSPLLEMTPSDSILKQIPFVHNAYISGLMGYLELQKMAGYTESTNTRTELNRLLNLKLTLWKNGELKDTPYNPYIFQDTYCRALSVSRNFMFLTPELADYIRNDSSSLAKVREAVNEYSWVAPDWFKSWNESTYNEGILHHVYDANALLTAKSYILKEPYEELVKYLDVPAFAVGDLFYIQNLVAVLSAASGGGSPTPTPIPEGDLNNDGKIDVSDLILLLFNYQSTDVKYDLNKDGGVNIFDSMILVANLGK